MSTYNKYVSIFRINSLLSFLLILITEIIPNHCRTVSGKDCIFPFIFKGNTYNACTMVNFASIPWCSTAVDSSTGIHIAGKWGNCMTGTRCPVIDSDNLAFWPEVKIAKGRHLDTFRKWGPSYTVEFDITASKFTPEDSYNGWNTNIFHFSDLKTLNHNSLSVYLAKKDIRFRNGGFTEYKFNATLEQQYHVVIRQQYSKSKAMYEIEIDGEIVLSEENKEPKELSNVMIYASNPWRFSFTSQYGKLENFKATHGPGLYFVNAPQ